MGKLVEKHGQVTELLELAMFYLLNSKFEEAIAQFKKVIELRPEDAEVYYDLGISYEGLNMTEEAKESFRKALELDPGLKKAEERLDRLIGV